jgi:hypothetical protein
MNRRERRKQQIARQRAAAALRTETSECGVTPECEAQPSGLMPSLSGGESLSLPSAPAAAASTGPRTTEGKAVSSRNAVKHNLCSTRLTGAALDELNAIRAKLDEEWEPQTETERMLLAQMALSQWRVDRALSLELHAFNDEMLDPALLALALRYRTAAERAFYKALSELQRLRTTIREDARRAERDEQKALEREIDQWINTPFTAVPRQFVPQTPSAAAPGGPADLISRTAPLPKPAASVS